MVMTLPEVPGYSDLQVAGRGGYSVVYRATQDDLGRPVAIKVLNVDLAEEGARRRFQRECTAIGLLSGVKGIVSVHQSVFTADGRPCIVMQHMDGGTLDQYVRRTGGVTHDEVIELGRVLATALASAHDRTVFHRDIKPGNILISGDGDVALADFGISLVADLTHSSQTAISLSPPHAPPERLTGEVFDEVRADIYSLGSTLYFAMAGEPPYGTAEEGGISGLTRRVVSAPLPSIQRTDLPQAVLEIVYRMLAKEPGHRYASASVVAAAFAALGGSSPSGPLPPSSPPAPSWPGPSNGNGSSGPISSPPMPDFADVVDLTASPALTPVPAVGSLTDAELNELPPPDGAIVIPARPAADTHSGPLAYMMPSAPPTPAPGPTPPAPVPSLTATNAVRTVTEPSSLPDDVTRAIWPTGTAYAIAVQDPASILAPELQSAELVRDLMGMPTSAAGQSAVVFQMSAPEGLVATRMFTRPPTNGPERYAALADHLASVDVPELVDAHWLPRAIAVDGTPRPAVIMPWVAGLPLGLAVEDLLRHPDRLRRLADEWLHLIDRLRAAGIAHGDLQNGNVLVDDDLTIRLVDLDGVWLSSSTLPSPAEFGHPNFQHPGRSHDDWGPDLDTFAAGVIHLSLLAIAADPDLWSFHRGENLILDAVDFADPDRHGVWDRLEVSPDPAVRRSAALVRQWCRAERPPAGSPRGLTEQDDAEPGIDATVMRPRPATAPAPLTVIDDSQDWWSAPAPGEDGAAAPGDAAYFDTSPRSASNSMSGPASPHPLSDGPAAKPGAAKGVVSTAVSSAAAPTDEVDARVSVVGRLGRTSMIAGACAGFVSGCIAVTLHSIVSESIDPRFQAGFLVVFVGVLLGGLLASWQDLTAKSWGSGVRRFLVGALIVGTFGLLAVLAADAAFQGLAERDAPVQPPVIGLVWAIVAAAIGLSVGIQRSPRAAVSGLVGGAGGGFVGGLILTEMTAMYVDPWGTILVDYATAKGVLTVACTAGVIGWSIGLAERVTRRAWLTMIEGELRGREWTLDRRVAKIGTGYGADVRLPPLAGIETVHVRVERARTGAMLTPLAPTKMNGRPIDGVTAVADGDVIEIGGCYLRYESRHPGGAAT